VLAWLSWSEVQTADLHTAQLMPLPLTVSSVKSRLVLFFWYRLTRVVPEKGPSNMCVFTLLILCNIGRLFSEVINSECFVAWQSVLSALVPVVEPLHSATSDETSEPLSSVETDLVLLVLRRYDAAVALTLTVTSSEMRLLITAVKSRRRRVTATTDHSLAAAAITQVLDGHLTDMPSQGHANSLTQKVNLPTVVCSLNE